VLSELVAVLKERQRGLEAEVASLKTCIKFYRKKRAYNRVGEEGDLNAEMEEEGLRP
jgi:hypothetical protein